MGSRTTHVLNQHLRLLVRACFAICLELFRCRMGVQLMTGHSNSIEFLLRSYHVLKWMRTAVFFCNEFTKKILFSLTNNFIQACVFNFVS